MHAEIDALEVNHTSTLTGTPLDKKSIGCENVYKIIKYNLDSFVQQFNAQLVTSGYYQENGLDYFVTFAPIAKSVIVRVLFPSFQSKDGISTNLRRGDTGMETH
jgi:hypothetical protein